MAKKTNLSYDYLRAIYSSKSMARIVIANAAARANGISYGKYIAGLYEDGTIVDTRPKERKGISYDDVASGTDAFREWFVTETIKKSEEIRKEAIKLQKTKERIDRDIKLDGDIQKAYNRAMRRLERSGFRKKVQKDEQ